MKNKDKKNFWKSWIINKILFSKSSKEEIFNYITSDTVDTNQI